MIRGTHCQLPERTKVVFKGHYYPPTFIRYYPTDALVNVGENARENSE